MSFGYYCECILLFMFNQNSATRIILDGICASEESTIIIKEQFVKFVPWTRPTHLKVCTLL